MIYCMVFHNVTQAQQFGAVLLVLAAVFASGYAASNMTHDSLTSELTAFDQFAYKAEEVDKMMQMTIENPTKYNLISTNNELVIVYRGWAMGETGENKELFLEYLDACILVIDDMQAGNEPDVSLMNEKYSELINE